MSIYVSVHAQSRSILNSGALSRICDLVFIKLSPQSSSAFPLVRRIVQPQSQEYGRYIILSSQCKCFFIHVIKEGSLRGILSHQLVMFLSTAPTSVLFHRDIDIFQCIFQNLCVIVSAQPNLSHFQSRCIQVFVYLPAFTCNGFIRSSAFVCCSSE